LRRARHRAEHAGMLTPRRLEPASPAPAARDRRSR
jgi:hypothetical protein